MKFYSITRIWLFLALCFSLATPLSEGMERQRKQLSPRELAHEIRGNQRLASYLQLLKSAIMYFYDTPGFQPTLTKMLLSNSQNEIKGHIFEIECALSLAQNRSEGELILAFNQDMQNQQTGTTRQFDIITDKRWIECKHKIQEKESKKKLKLEQQFTEQKSIALHRSKQYCVCSRQEIPNWWQNWFKENKILFEHFTPAIKFITLESNNVKGLDPLLMFLKVLEEACDNYEAGASYAAYITRQDDYNIQKKINNNPKPVSLDKAVKTEVQSESSNLKQASSKPEPSNLSKAPQAQPAKSRLALYLICITSIIYWLYYQA